MIALRRHAPRVAVLVALASCSEGDEGSPCGELECEVPSSKAELVAELEGFADPVAS